MTSAILNHLLQSTIFAALCGALTLSLRRNRAQVRYGLWVAASAKFLIPFSALIAFGRTAGHRLLPSIVAHNFVLIGSTSDPIVRTVTVSAKRIPIVLAEQTTVAESTVAIALAVWALGTALLLVRWTLQWRSLARSVARATVVDSGREVVILRRLEDAMCVRRRLTLLVSDARLEPGVFGWLAPRLLWPRSISAHLNDSQIEAILAHELSHARRFDNVVAAAQMLVQAVFWFHPLVWWIGGRLVDERERACDEAVLMQGSEPEDYAESILKTCRFAIESPLVCVAGVTGADLKWRIETIMANRPTETMSILKRSLVSSVAVASIALPIAVGVVGAPRVRAQANALRIGEQKFEVASVKPNNSGGGPTQIALQPGGRLTVENMSLRVLIRFAFQVQESELIGGPDWLDKERFDITAKADHDFQPAPPGTTGPGQLMLRSLLAERFRLAIHQEQREQPVYALVLARSDGRFGPQLKTSTVDCQAVTAAARGRGGPPPMVDGRPQCGMRISPGTLLGGGFPMSQLATSLSQFVRRSVMDRTSLMGNYDIELHWTPEQMAQGTAPPGAPPLPPIDPNGPSIFTAVQEQLGLKLESTKESLTVLVIDDVDRPSPD